MRYLAILAAVAMMMPLGCCPPDQQTDQTMGLPPEERPLETMAPAEWSTSPPSHETPTEITVATPPPVESEPTALVSLAPPEPTPAPVVALPPAPAGPRIHTVARGDTFWSLAVRYLGDGQRWRDIQAANPGAVPTKLRIGQKIVIPAK